MPTNPYAEYQETKPTAADAGTAVADNTRTNLLALRDAAVSGGGPVGWNINTITYTSGKITQIIYSKGTERIKIDFTYVVGGAADGNVQDETYRYSSDSGTSYVLMIATGFSNAKRTYSYDGSGNLTGATWS